MNTTVSPLLAEQLIAQRRSKNLASYGEQNHADGTDRKPRRLAQRASARRQVEVEASSGGPTWLSILKEEVAEIACESDEEKLLDELVDAGAVIADWIECIKRRQVRRAQR